MRKPLIKRLFPEMKKVVAVDFDGCLHKGQKYPFIGTPNEPLLHFIRTNRDKYIFVLWTCREGKQLAFAIEWLKQQGIVFDFVNQNVPWHIEAFGNDSRKIFADYYIDDRNISEEEFIKGDKQ